MLDGLSNDFVGQCDGRDMVEGCEPEKGWYCNAVKIHFEEQKTDAASVSLSQSDFDGLISFQSRRRGAVIFCDLVRRRRWISSSLLIMLCCVVHFEAQNSSSQLHQYPKQLEEHNDKENKEEEENEDQLQVHDHKFIYIARCPESGVLNHNRGDGKSTSTHGPPLVVIRNHIWNETPFTTGPA